MSAGVFFSWMMIGLTLAIAALFVSTVLGRSVAERRIEFATLRAIGLSRWTILATVAGEAALICILAAVGGSMMASVLGGWTNRSIAPQYGIEVLYVEDPPMFATLLVVSVVVGLVSGLIPARQATSVDPVEVLRDA
ncbi:MAG: ABC transporter permease [Proteobacteria bacterium]|nr:ABC transporter permease [Pseudomonadota bacterium]